MSQVNKIAVCMIWAVLLSGTAARAQEQAGDYTPVKLSLIPGAALWDKDYVAGLDFGLATETRHLEGVQVGIFYAGLTEYAIGAQNGLVAVSQDFDGAKSGLLSISRNVRGYQSGLVNIAEQFIGVQDGVVTLNQSIKGVQYGVVNVSQNVSGLQFGVVNYTDALKGLQIGVLNIITRSSLPVMVVANASF